MPSPEIRVGLVTTPAERAAWEDLATRSAAGHRHQCLWWMEPLTRYGFRISAIGCWRGDRLVGGALFRSYAVPLTGATMSECLDGPVFLEWDSSWADAFVTALTDLARRAGSIAVVIKDCPQEDVHRDILAAMSRRGLATALTRGPADAVLPLEGRGIDEIRRGFNHGTRGRIRKGQAGLTVRKLTTRDDLARAYSAWIATANRRSFTDVRPWAGLEPVLHHCIEHQLGWVLGSFLGDKLLAAAFIVHVGKTAAYVYGGYMDGAEKQSPTHVMQFEAIRESLDRGAAAYNFGNLISVDGGEGRGVDEFKLGFGALPQRHLDTIIWKRRPILYGAIERARRARIGGRLEALLKRMLIRRGESVQNS